MGRSGKGIDSVLQPHPRPPRRMVRRVSFQAGSSTPLHLIGVELEKEGDDFGFVRVVRKAVGMSPERSEHCEAMSLDGCNGQDGGW